MIKRALNSVKLSELSKRAYSENRRLVAPLVGFPGCDIIKCSIKMAQQNHAMHYNAIEALAYHLKPDAVFMMMDLSVEANAIGLPVRFPTNESSSVELHPVKTVEDLDRYRCINILADARIQSYLKTIEMMRLGLKKDVLVGAYVIGPFSFAGLLMGAQNAAMDSMIDPDKLECACQFCTSIIMEYTQALINAGADLICILEPTAAILGPEQFSQFSGEYVKHIIESYKYSNVDTIYHICGNTMHLVKAMSQIGVGAISLDSPDAGIDLAKVAQMVPEDIAIIGNVNPTKVMKDGIVEEVKQATTELLTQMKDYPNFILSTACDLPPGTPLKNMLAFMETGRNYK
ncbi:MAG: uroporphyrinogen decarboxylase family protein [Anaerohalosphaeraceae bacterium]|nr:uroporphyrinogen decarboxylase family protein [Anaerohalosphaeraceae bacterium]